jgi:hypothetical protein
MVSFLRRVGIGVAGHLASYANPFVLALTAKKNWVDLRVYLRSPIDPFDLSSWA